MKKLTKFSIVLIILAFCELASAEWTTPQPVVDGINTSAHEFWPFLSFDGKTLYFSRGDGHHYDIWQATREDTSGPFTSVTMALARGSNWCILGPWVSPDNLRMYYHDEGSVWHLRVSTRASVNDPWTLGVTIPGLSSFTQAQTPRLSQDELIIVFDSYNGSQNSYDLYIATRPSISSPFGNVRNLSELNSPAPDAGQFLTPDGLTLYFNSSRNGTGQIFKATRASRAEPFGNIEHLSFFDSPTGVGTPSLSADASTIFFAKGMSGINYGDIYFSNLITGVELAIIRINAAIDEKVKALEAIDSAMAKEGDAMTELIKALRSKDLGDLTKNDILLALQKVRTAGIAENSSQKTLDLSIDRLEEALENLGVEPEPELDPNLIAWWKLDETSGTIAYDSAGSNDGTLYGGPMWTAGWNNGALNFDGKDDYVDCGNAASLDISGSISIAAWVKFNSLPMYQTIVSKRGPESNWATNYTLRTGRTATGANDEFEFAYKSDSQWHIYTTSNVNIIVGNWYHVAATFTFGTASTIKLYVNGNLVSGNWTMGDGNSPVQINTQPLTIGSNLDDERTGGTIDDLRIYNRALPSEEVVQLYHGNL